MWDLPGPGLEPVSPALAGGFLTTAPPGKSKCLTVFHKLKLGQIRQTPSNGVLECMLRVRVVSYPFNNVNHRQIGRINFLSQNLILKLLGSWAGFRTPTINTSGILNLR